MLTNNQRLFVSARRKAKPSRVGDVGGQGLGPITESEGDQS